MTEEPMEHLNFYKGHRTAISFISIVIKNKMFHRLSPIMLYQHSVLV